MEVSSATGEGVGAVHELLKGAYDPRFGLNSGVGKSTLIRAIDPSLDIRTGEISEKPQGRHTTTFRRCIRWQGGAVIDTPGIKGWADRHRRCRCGITSRNDARPRLPVLQLYPHPRTGMCGRSRRTGADRLSRYESYLKILDEDENTANKGAEWYAERIACLAEFTTSERYEYSAARSPCVRAT